MEDADLVVRGFGTELVLVEFGVEVLRFGGLFFFTFEFVHYLVDVLRGSPPIRRLRDYLAFALFWPTIVAGSIKRYQQFVPKADSDGLDVAGIRPVEVAAPTATVTGWNVRAAGRRPGHGFTGAPGFARPRAR